MKKLALALIIALGLNSQALAETDPTVSTEEQSPATADKNSVTPDENPAAESEQQPAQPKLGVHFAGYSYEVGEFVSTGSDVLVLSVHQPVSEYLEVAGSISLALSHNEAGINQDTYKPSSLSLINIKGSYIPFGDTRFRPFLAAGLGLGSVSIERVGDDESEKESLTSPFFGFGFRFNITDSSEFMFGYDLYANDANMEAIGLGLVFQL